MPERSAPSTAVGRPNATQVGTLVFLASELMFFAGLFAMYFTLRGVVPENFWAGQSNFTHGFSILNTLILVASSIPAQMGVWMAEGHLPGGRSFTPRRNRTGSIFNIARWGMVEWYTLTFMMGSLFIAGQAYEYTELVHYGVTLSSSPFGSAFYLATGFHGIHVIGGLIAFLFVLARAFTATNFTHSEQVSVICLSYYWHFVGIVWAALFSVIFLIDPIMGNVPFDPTVF